MNENKLLMVTTLISLGLVTGVFGIIFLFANNNSLPRIRSTEDNQSNAVFSLAVDRLT